MYVGVWMPRGFCNCWVDGTWWRQWSPRSPPNLIWEVPAVWSVTCDLWPVTVYNFNWLTWHQMDTHTLSEGEELRKGQHICLLGPSMSKSYESLLLVTDLPHKNILTKIVCHCTSTVLCVPIWSPTSALRSSSSQYVTRYRSGTGLYPVFSLLQSSYIVTIFHCCNRPALKRHTNYDCRHKTT